MNIADRLSRLAEAFGADGPVRGVYWKFRCPCHDDATASAELWERDGKLFIGCWVCAAPGTPAELAKAVKTRMLKAVGLTWKDILGDTPMQPLVQQRITARYSYRDANGELLYQKIRREPGRGGRSKDFTIRRPDPDNPEKWAYNLGGCPRVLYRLPELRKARLADSGVWVLLCAGEKDCDAGAALGFTITTNVEGESTPWQREYSEELCGVNVAIIPDSDPVGWRHAGDAAWSLIRHGCRVRWVTLPGAETKDGYDLSDWVKAMGPVPRRDLAAMLAGLVENAAELRRGHDGET